MSTLSRAHPMPLLSSRLCAGTLRTHACLLLQMPGREEVRCNKFSRYDETLTQNPHPYPKP